MVLEIIAAAVLIAFGILAVFFSIEEDVSDSRLMLILIVGMLAVFAGVWLIISTLTLGLVLKKLVGLVLTGFGIFLIIGFPDVHEYQPFPVSRAGIFIGIIIAVIGVYLLLF